VQLIEVYHAKFFNQPIMGRTLGLNEENQEIRIKCEMKETLIISLSSLRVALLSFPSLIG
jgi:hypothetical protein